MSKNMDFERISDLFPDPKKPEKDTLKLTSDCPRNHQNLYLELSTRTFPGTLDPPKIQKEGCKLTPDDVKMMKIFQVKNTKICGASENLWRIGQNAQLLFGGFPDPFFQNARKFPKFAEFLK